MFCLIILQIMNALIVKEDKNGSEEDFKLFTTAESQ